MVPLTLAPPTMALLIMVPLTLVPPTMVPLTVALLPMLLTQHLFLSLLPLILPYRHSLI